MFRPVLGSDQTNSVKNTEINKQSHVIEKNMEVSRTYVLHKLYVIIHSIYVLTYIFLNFQVRQTNILMTFFGRIGSLRDHKAYTLLNFDEILLIK